MFKWFNLLGAHLKCAWTSVYNKQNYQKMWVYRVLYFCP